MEAIPSGVPNASGPREEAASGPFAGLLARLEAVEAAVQALSLRVDELEAGRVEFRRTLNRLGEALASTHDRPAMLSAVLETCAMYVRARAAVFYGVVGGTDGLRPLAACGQAAVPVAELGELAPGEGLAGAVGAAGEVIRWPSAAVDTLSAAEPPASTTAVAVPVRSGGRPFGVLAFYDRESGQAFSAEDVEALATLVRQVEPAIENTFLYDEASRLAITDGLTSLWNRRQFDLSLSREHQRAVRFSEPFAVVLLDLDHLKEVNDTLGHQAGDALLVEVSHRLMSGVRDVDLIARFGGDEFGLILPNTGLGGAVHLAEKVRAAIGDDPYDLKEGEPVHVTASIGVAAFPEHGRNGRALVKAADEALYRAKANGKNRVEAAGSSE